MQATQIKRPSLRIFENDLLEKFSHVHPITPLVIWGPVVSGLFWHTYGVRHMAVGSMVLLSLAGFFTWTLAEYLMHRYIFHFDAKTELQKRLQFIIHGNHHDDPQDPTRLVMPPLASIIFAVGFYIIFRLLMGGFLAEPFFASFVLGYLFYDYIHFSVHHFTPRTRVGKYLKHSHMIHHFVSQDGRWGVSSPLWDYFFSSLGKTPKRQSPMSQSSNIKPKPSTAS